MNFIDDILNQVTMYRLVLYYVLLLLIVAVIFSSIGILSLNPLSLILSTLFIVAVSFLVNKVFAKVYGSPTNFESVYISSPILALIITPAKSFHDIIFLFWAASLTMASKFILAIGKKHIFNPVAIAVVLTSFGFNGSASWWIGTGAMAPFVILGGLLVVRKIQREDMVFSFFLVGVITVLVFSIISGNSLSLMMQKILLDSSLLFLAFVMLTEPLTTPPTKKLQIFYGGLVGFLFAPQIHIGTLYSTPELSLCIGNLFSFLVSPKYKLMLKVKEKLQFGKDVINFVFPLNKKISFTPGQYMEWTIPHKNPDSRGNRRYFTIASSPTEDVLHLGVKFYPKGSSFKKAMLALDDKTAIGAAQIAGDFTLPKNKNQKCVFIAGGIGITPFRSMIKYLLDKNESRPIVLFYANKKMNEIAYYDVFSQAQEKLGIKTVYTLTDKESVPNEWNGYIGRIDADMIKKEVPDFLSRTYYLSGPHTMITGFEEVLVSMGVAHRQIKKDFFPGFT